ncbi:hypothetical protein FDP41_011565 [Naegleria fowleri]|uniref:Uncharacterized protein n=1 Tax=Naegleria fowleri TaxID=5763 RepID=A0A6A5CBA3_NAEFO|nr:uncharacterized protein FDP41_011679 [Naegleria fowleri]XP_044567348.1 uncharacterized protein FDP41_011565 [Naegleria fowleri]KAF0982224.1 hypothetical protein FDP41_011679 [Naegleria fowleri]KAF0982635.1 hypothetical protein FDP41_011565 [Naegleria fowleri]
MLCRGSGRDMTIAKYSSQQGHHDQPLKVTTSGNHQGEKKPLSSVPNLSPTCSSSQEFSYRNITFSFHGSLDPQCKFSDCSEHYGLSLYVPSSSPPPLVDYKQQHSSYQVVISQRLSPPIHSPVANSSSQTTLSPNSPNCNSLSPSEKRPLKFFDYNKRKIAKKVRRVDQVQPYEHVIQMQTTTTNKKNSPTSRSSILSPNTRISIQNKDIPQTTMLTCETNSTRTHCAQEQTLRREVQADQLSIHGSNSTNTTTTATRKRTPRYSISIKELLN